MRMTFIIISILSLSSIGAEELTFRGYPFGTSIDTIIAKEGVPSSSENKASGAGLIGDEYIRYDKVTVAGQSAIMEIEFENKGMIAGSYRILFRSNLLSNIVFDPVNASQIYNDLYKKLMEIYGKPKQEKNIEYINEMVSTLYARQIANAAPYQALWEYFDGLVILSLDYKDQWLMNIIYLSPDIYKKMKSNISNKSGL